MLPRCDDDPGALPGGRSLQPRQQLGRVADGRRQPDPLERAARDARQPFEDGEQVPAPVPGAEGMHLVHDHGPQVGEQPPVVDAGADEHRLKRLRRGEQQVGRVGEHGLAAGRRGVAVPERDPAASPGAVDLEARQQVVEQRLQRAQVDHRQAGPALGGHPGQHREGGRLGLAARGGREQQRVVTAQHRSERVALERAERGPAERVHHVVGQRRVQAAERPGLRADASVTGRGPRRRRWRDGTRPRCARSR